MATLSGKTVVVVGGTSGIGFGVAKGALLTQAAKVIVASSTQTKVDKAVQILQALITAKSLPGTVVGQVVDANDVGAVKAFVEAVGEIDHFVWTSGAIHPVGDAFTVEFMQGIMNLRFWSPITAAKTVKIKAGGSITFTIGSVAFKPPKGWGLAAGIPGGIDALTRGLAVDLAPVRVNVISPGAVKTPLWDGLPAEMVKGIIAQAEAKLPVKHVADADEVAEAYLFAMKCNYLTGQTIQVDGGYMIV